MHAFTLGTDGYFRRDGAPFVPMGVNYWPVSCRDGQEMWARWPADEIQADLAQIAATGFNAVRVDPRSTDGHLEHIAEFVRLGLGADLAVLVGENDDFVCDGALPGGATEGVAFSARPGSHVLGHDGLLDPFFQTFLPFAVNRARVRRPVVVTALGFCEPVGARQCDAFLRACLPAARGAGAAGYFWRGWRDGGSFDDGWLGADGGVKPGHEFFREFGLSVAASAPPKSSREVVGLFAPAAGAFSVETHRRLLLASYLLGCTGRATMQMAAPASDGRCRQLLVAGGPVDSADVAGLLAWVQSGGELFWHGPDLLTWSRELEALLGARPVDWRSARGISVNAFGERFTMAHFPHDARAELEPWGATVLAQDQLGLPVLLEHRVGGGRVRYALPIVEEAIVPVAAHPIARDRWAAWYRGMLTT